MPKSPLLLPRRQSDPLYRAKHYVDFRAGMPDPAREERVQRLRSLSARPTVGQEAEAVTTPFGTTTAPVITDFTSGQHGHLNAAGGGTLTVAAMPALAAAFTPASAAGPASFAFHEDTDNGTNKITVAAPASLAGDVALTWPAAPGTVALKGQAPFIVPFVLFPFATITATSVWTNMPAATTELYGSTVQRKRADLTNATEFRLHVGLTTIGAAAATLTAEYATNITTPTWTTMGGGASIATTTGWKTGGWTAVPAGAKADVLLRIVGVNGDGVADPNFTDIYLEVR